MAQPNKKKPNRRISISKTALVAIWLGVGLTALYFFIQSEGSRLLNSIISLLALWSIYLALTKRRELAIILSGFLGTVAIFNLSDSGAIPSPIASLIFIILYIFLFYLFHSEGVLSLERLRDNQIKIYAGLCLLLVAEFFLVLKFFPIDAKNKSILIILFFWYFNQIFYFQSQKKLTAGISINLTLTFLIILAAILYTLPFLGR